MDDKVKLFLQYMKKEIELNREWDKEDGIDVDADDYKISLTCVDRVKSFISYRNLRIEEAWYNKLNAGKNSREVREKVYAYDAERSRRHSVALNSMIGFNIFGERYGLPPFYDGEMLKASEIESYKNIPARKAETEFFLKFIDKLSRMSSIKLKKYFEEVGIDENSKQENEFIKELQSNLETVDRKYGVEEPLLEEDAKIKFVDTKLIDRYNR